MPLRTSPNHDKPVTVPLTLRRGGRTQVIGKAIVCNYRVLSTRLKDSVDDELREFVNSDSCAKTMVVDYDYRFNVTGVRMFASEKFSLDRPYHDLAKLTAERSGLPIETCSTLLTFGWAFIEEYNKIPRWEHPTRELKDFDVNYRACIGSFDVPVTEDTVCDICGLKLKEHPWFDDVTISPVSVDLKEKK